MYIQVAMMSRPVARVDSSHPDLENDSSSSLVSHRLRISPWLRFSILEFIRNTKQYDALRVEILRNPIGHDKDAEFLTSLKSLMDPIESMRNCVAHNRRPTRSIADNYPNARRELEERLNEYLTQWEVQNDN